MNGECKSYRLNDPMTLDEFMSMPDDIKCTYIKLIRKKFNAPVTQIAKMMGVSEATVRKELKRLGLNEGKTRSGKTKWDMEGFYAWWHGVDKLPEPVPEEPVEAPVISEITQDDIDEIEEMMPGVKNLHIQAETYVEDDLPYEESDPITAEEIIAMQIRIDELLKSNEELLAFLEKCDAENAWLRNECDNQRMQVRILEAQMDVVRMIFGGKNNG